MKIKFLILNMALLFLASCSNKDANRIESIINEYNYIRLVPASNVFKSGSIVFREKYDPSISNPKSTSIGSLCSDRFAVDRYPYKPEVSRSEIRELKKLQNGKFNVEASFLRNLLGLTATAAAARNVTISFTNLRLNAYSKEDLQNIQAGLGDICRKIVNKNVETNNAYHIRETLTANLKFTVDLEADVDISAKQNVIKELGKIGFVVDSNSSLKVTGKGLVYGIKWDQIIRKL